MNNVDIIKSTYEGKNSEENGRNLALYADENISWTKRKVSLMAAPISAWKKLPEVFSASSEVNGTITNLLPKIIRQTVIRL
ncbi:hypothetical protein [uncultured Chryseobacterium sp.]|uniref:hypothetical protein n=1 Tax=uncultured Chryseobacterium sp. TaxID=259322 RepID=UPI0025FAEF04|nr:hypothetical protein [uncultured Chryseobacterium sp.]